MRAAVRRMGFLVAFVGLVAGCATAAGLAPGGGRTLVVEGRTYDEIWNAATRVVLRTLTAIVESDKARGRLTAEQKPGLATSGEVVGVFISPADVPSPRYTVEVVSRKRARGQLTGQDWEPTIIEALRLELGLP